MLVKYQHTLVLASVKFLFSLLAHLEFSGKSNQNESINKSISSSYLYLQRELGTTHVYVQ